MTTVNKWTIYACIVFKCLCQLYQLCTKKANTPIELSNRQQIFKKKRTQNTREL
jgi:hypothetical protein